MTARKAWIAAPMIALASAAAALAQEAPQSSAVPVVLGAGTMLEVELLDDLSSDAAFPGDRFRAQLTEDLPGEGDEPLLAAGTTVAGRVTGVARSTRTGTVARLALVFDRLELPTGRLPDVRASLPGEPLEDRAQRLAATAGGTVIVDSVIFAGLARSYLLDDTGRLVAALAPGAGNVLVAPAPATELSLPAGTVLTLRLDVPLRLPTR